MKESDFQKEVKDTIRLLFPGCLILKNDPADIPGIPDLLILYENKWAALECKKSADATHRPLQDYYIDKMDKMSFASLIFPENKEDVLSELVRSFEA